MALLCLVTKFIDSLDATGAAGKLQYQTFQALRTLHRRSFLVQEQVDINETFQYEE